MDPIEKKVRDTVADKRLARALVTWWVVGSAVVAAVAWLASDALDVVPTWGLLVLGVVAATVVNSAAWRARNRAARSMREG